MKSLYRRYRPLKLSEVVGQEQVTKPLANAMKADKVSHAYLFVGPRGTGKTSVARIFAHEINGFPYELEDNYVDIIEIDGASNRGIDDIRELREKVLIAPTTGKYKVYIIDEVHMLTNEAFNALLKTLEEPPRYVIFIMATTDAYKVPATITSRAQVYNFKLAEPSVMLKHLNNICEKEKINIDPEALEIVVKRGGGSYRDTLSLLDQISTLSEKKITKDLVISALGLAENEKIKKLIFDYTSGSLMAITEDLKALYATGVEAKTLAEELMDFIINTPRPEYLSLLARLSEVKTPYAEARLLVALTGELPVIARRSLPPEQKANPVKTAPDSSFSWEMFLEKVHGLNDAIWLQLKNCEHSCSDTTLNIYPAKKIAKTILSRDNNQRVLAEAAGSMVVVIHDVADGLELKKDELISKMSDIMGGEVKNDTGGNPF